jgi:hypothetical protein
MHHGGIGVHGSAIAPKYDGKSHNHLVLVSHKLHHVSEDSSSYCNWQKGIADFDSQKHVEEAACVIEWIGGDHDAALQ